MMMGDVADGGGPPVRRTVCTLGGLPDEALVTRSARGMGGDRPANWAATNDAGAD